MTEETKDQSPAPKAKPKPAPKAKLVKMVREDGKTADVHPDMVGEYKKGGFREEKWPLLSRAALSLLARTAT